MTLIIISRSLPLIHLTSAALAPGKNRAGQTALPLRFSIPRSLLSRSFINFPCYIMPSQL